jgi:SAM-dependent methyltransferase
MVVQTIYGSLTRYEWIKSFLTKDQKIIDLGCGTGYMITLPLLQEGFDVIGVDLCSKSIEYGKRLLEEQGLSKDRLVCLDLKDIDSVPDVMLLSEVLEHLNDEQFDQLMTLCSKKLSLGGLILITVPNGWGLFELDSFIWFKLKLGAFLGWSGIERLCIIAKNKIVGKNTVISIPSSLDSSPHIQRFTYSNLPKRLAKYNFTVLARQGGSLISGPLANLLFTGFSPIMKLNMLLGRWLPYLAADFYVAIQKK